MTTLAQGDLPNTLGMLKTAARHNDVRVGIYVSVIESGMIHAGDNVSACSES